MNLDINTPALIDPLLRDHLKSCKNCNRKYKKITAKGKEVLNNAFAALATKNRLETDMAKTNNNKKFEEIDLVPIEELFKKTLEQTYNLTVSLKKISPQDSKLNQTIIDHYRQT
jgi:hypothetical protein